jgi:hypothetical protein
LKVPAGALAWPNEFAPQQASVSFVLTPQPWESPAETELNAPAGGLACPESSSPQQASAPPA